MPTKKTAATLEELNAQIAKLQAQAEVLRKQEIADVVARIRGAIEHYGLTAADLGLGAAKPKSTRTVGPRVASKARGKAAARKPARAIKFADAQGNSWSGVGKRPNWFKDALAAGKKAEDLLVKANATGN